MCCWGAKATSGGMGAANMTSTPNIRVSLDAADLTWAVAEFIVQRATEAIRARGRFSIALSGGSTPLPLFALLALPEWQARLQWAKVHVFWADERCVPPDHKDSNYAVANAAFLERLPIPKNHIHRMRGEIDPTQAALEYEAELRQFFGGDETPFDLVLLGMGDDGHTASLFPGTAPIHETTRRVVAHEVKKVNMWRLTLTPPAINAAAVAAFMVSGEGKAERLRDVIKGPFQPDMLPSQAIHPQSGQLLWFVDQPAAALLT